MSAPATCEVCTYDTTSVEHGICVRLQANSMSEGHIREAVAALATYVVETVVAAFRQAAQDWPVVEAARWADLRAREIDEGLVTP